MTLVARQRLPAHAVELYERARELPVGFRFDAAEETLKLLGQAIDAAPDFALARAAFATATLRAWFVPGTVAAAGLEEKAREAVASAVEADSELPETQLAVARLAVQDGRWRAAAHSLRRALELMPSSADGHAYLGLLQVEAGLVEQGLEHLRWAKALEPKRDQYDFEVARQAALRGDLATYDQQVRSLADPDRGLDLLFLELRVAAWYRHDDKVAELLDFADAVDHPAIPSLAMHGRALLGRESIAALERSATTVLVSPEINPRFRTICLQLLTETLALCGERDGALRRLEEAASGPLVDVVWLEKCPALESLRSTPVFRRAAQRVRGRCSAIWQA